MGPDRLPSDWPLKEYSEFVHCAGTLWHTQRIGAGPVILLLHGTGSSTHSMAGIAEHLSDQFTCLLVDLPGQGFTQAIEEREHLLTAMANAISTLCKQLKLDPDYVIGHSAGAAVSIPAPLLTDCKRGGSGTPALLLGALGLPSRCSEG